MKPPPLVPVAAIVNALKCELAETFANRNFGRDLLKTDPQGNATIDVTLSLGNVTAKGRSGEAGLEVAPLGITLGPSGSRGRTVTATDSIEFEFSYAASDGRAVPAFCTALESSAKAGRGAGTPPVTVVEGDPFVTLLNGIKAEYDKVKPGEPKVSFGPLSYTSAFEIERSEEFGAEVAFLVFKIGGKQSKTTTISQEVTLKFDISKLPPLIPPG
ncbi:hypothetical protein FHR22_000136 [Sphingopyxis panaciterrae]|uniref:hypothetical protein n=1 Tax=Sphingopyxis panaciterrae TaxID=363841 RepID=UPI00141DC6E5|nr:hypothetical protein [Sphingopyxis panaciterrae]NIJ35487.1 hypothetical protein [Sphingopyxis panaciterrae]